ncbi:PspC domain-containing protein, partial [Flavobacteriaceae bacterium]|nr:PspC domain-containing protein [Flavobacteriaceae bacterium]
MNKTININLASTFFHMDESAYAILKAYLNKLELAFKNTVGKDEILKDIETRIAELFQERKTNPDYVISEVDVNEIISILGQPQDFILEEDENSDHKETKSEKKLFRDPEDKYIGGVASGLGYYFGIDASWIRLLWILFALFS